jgi:hypothetical protein
MQDAQRIDRILADISLCGRLDDSDVRSIVQRLRDHCFENVQVSLDQCLGWLDDDIGEEPELSSIDSKPEKLEVLRVLEPADKVPTWMKHAVSI